MTNSGQIDVVVRQRSGDSRPLDRRVVRTRRALLQAFITLLQERSYRGVTIGDIVACADVGRSTFYEHFRDKDAILLTSMEWMFAILADATQPDALREPLEQLATHFWNNRSLARAVLAHPVQPKLARALIKIIEERPLTGKPPNQRLRAVAIAAGQLGILGAWTRGELTANASEVADALLAIAQTMSISGKLTGPRLSSG